MPVLITSANGTQQTVPTLGDFSVATPFPTGVVASAMQFFSNYATSTRVSSSILKASAGRLCALDADGTALVSNAYLQFFNTTTLPAAGTRCFRYFPILPGSFLLLGRNELEIDFSTGIVVAVSSVRDTYTAVTDLANTYFTVSYR